MADYLLYWKSFWRATENNLFDRDFRWHTKQDGFWRNVEAGDNLWTIASGGDYAPDEWRLVDRIVAREKFTNFDFDWPFGIIGDPARSEAYDVEMQPDLTPLLLRLEFESGMRLSVHGRAIGNAIQKHRRLSVADSLLLKDYARGLERIDASVDAINEVIGVSEQDFSPRLSSTGAGFGNPETNRKVERAAVAAVTDWYEAEGWSVKSVEADKCGYDLLCKQGTDEKHVEVKGVQGDLVAFIITAGEVRRAESDSDFVLCVVTSALNDNSDLNFYDVASFVSDFELSTLAYRAVLRG
jgi:hypothetical protein